MVFNSGHAYVAAKNILKQTKKKQFQRLDADLNSSDNENLTGGLSGELPEVLEYFACVGVAVVSPGPAAGAHALGLADHGVVTRGARPIQRVHTVRVRETYTLKVIQVYVCK